MSTNGGAMLMATFRLNSLPCLESGKHHNIGLCTSLEGVLCTTALIQGYRWLLKTEKSQRFFLYARKKLDGFPSMKPIHQPSPIANLAVNNKTSNQKFQPFPFSPILAFDTWRGQGKEKDQHPLPWVCIPQKHCQTRGGGKTWLFKVDMRLFVRSSDEVK